MLSIISPHRVPLRPGIEEIAEVFDVPPSLAVFLVRVSRMFYIIGDIVPLK